MTTNTDRHQMFGNTLYYLRYVNICIYNVFLTLQYIYTALYKVFSRDHFLSYSYTYLYLNVRHACSIRTSQVHAGWMLYRKMFVSHWPKVKLRDKRLYLVCAKRSISWVFISIFSSLFSNTSAHFNVLYAHSNVSTVHLYSKKLQSRSFLLFYSLLDCAYIYALKRRSIFGLSKYEQNRTRYVFYSIRSNIWHMLWLYGKWSILGLAFLFFSIYEFIIAPYVFL